MYIERKQQLSLYYFLVDLFSDASFVKVVDDWPDDPLTLPTVSVETDVIDTQPLELGSTNRIQYRSWYINVFAKTKTQRDEFGYRILNALKGKVPVYDYDEGFPPSVSPSSLGNMQLESSRYKNIKIQPDLVDTLYYRVEINYISSYDRV